LTDKSIWYNEDCQEIKTIFVRFNVRGQSWIWCGFRKEGEVLMCFRVAQGIDPVDLSGPLVFDGLFSVRFVNGIPEIVEAPSGERFVDVETTLFIYDNLVDPLYKFLPQLCVANVSIGTGSRSQGAIEKERSVYTPIPTNDDMDRIRSLLPSGDWKSFDDQRRTWGNSIRLCLASSTDVEISLRDTLNRIWDLNDFAGAKLVAQIFERGSLGHRLLRVMAVRSWPWKGFKSLCHHELSWASGALEVAVGERLITLMKPKTSSEVSNFMSTWGGGNRSLWGQMVERFFPEFLRVQKICGKKAQVSVDLKRGKDGNGCLRLKVSRDPLLWQQDSLWKPMTVVVGLDNLIDLEYCCCQAEKSNQRMYDAVIVPSEGPIDVIQVTVSNRHNVLTREFENLYKKFPGRKFRFFMIRVVLCAYDVDSACGEPMTWVMSGPKEKLEGFPKDVEWYEFVLDFGSALANYLNMMKSENCEPIRKAAAQSKE
jgi:hypothetical protein